MTRTSTKENASRATDDSDATALTDSWILDDSPWQMSFGERAALEGLLSQLQPKRAIEVGTAEGGSLRCLAQHCEEVHCFDLSSPDAGLLDVPGIVMHEGDSHELLPGVLEGFAERGQQVDFALVDGDHSPDGVQRDVEDLLNSSAVSQAVIVAHDTTNERVREGLERVRFDSYPKTAYVDLDFLPGFVLKKPPFMNELWGGLGIVIVDSRRSAYTGVSPFDTSRYSAFELTMEGWQSRSKRERTLGKVDGLAVTNARTVAMLEVELAKVVDELEVRKSELEVRKSELGSVQSLNQELLGSVSWRMTAPLRAFSQRLRARAAQLKRS